MNKTPIKQSDRNEKKCLVCGKYPTEVRRVESSRIKGKSLQDLLRKYGGINIESGIICRSCYMKLDNLHQKCTQFYDDCQKNIKSVVTNVKRMSSSPCANQSKIPNTCTRITNTSKIESDRLQQSSMSDHQDTRISDHNEDVQPLPDSRKTLKPRSLIFSDHSYVQQEPKKETLKKSYVRTSENTSDFATPVDHDYISSQTAPTVFNPVILGISKLSKDILYPPQKTTVDKIKLNQLVECTYVEEVADNLLKSEKYRKAILKVLCEEIQTTSTQLGNRTLNYVSSLMSYKSEKNLKLVNWCEIAEEMMNKFPGIFIMLLTMMVKPVDLHCCTKIEKVIPKLCMIYGIVMQSFNKELSRVQRVLSMVLFDNICDQKVYDRLQTLGLCLSYDRSLSLVEQIGRNLTDRLAELISQGKRFRIVGDNINWHVGVHDQRMDNKPRMEHAFGSAVIVQNIDFSHLSDTNPMQHQNLVNVQTFIPSASDIKDISRDYIILISRVAFKHVPYLRMFEDIVPEFISIPYNAQQKQKSEIIPLPVVFLNEQYYQDVVQILDFYENCLTEGYRKAGKEIEGEKVHIGGDQLTRERFSGAKTLRAHHLSSTERFDHLSPITNEMFHMHMNYLKMVYKVLYSDTSIQDLGTMKSLKERISRSNVGHNVNEHYDADKDFFVSVTDAYIIECLLHFFGMETVHSHPTKNVPPCFENQEEMGTWYFKTIGDLVEKYIIRQNTGAVVSSEILQVDGQTFDIKLANGKVITLVSPHVSKPVKADYVQNYAHQLLEFGLLFKDLLDLTKLPDRSRGIKLFKLAMLYFKSHKNLSKYALELLRLLVHQICLLPEKDANEEFYGLYVNTNGTFTGHIPADQRMEYLVKKEKEHIKHMFSNKTQENIKHRSSAISEISDIAINFDKQSRVIIRSKKHSDKSALHDEVVLLEDLRKIRPFENIPGRHHEAFPEINPSIVDSLNVENYHVWIDTRKSKFTLELGN